MINRQGSCRLTLVVCLGILVVFTIDTCHRGPLVAEAAQSSQRSLNQNETKATPPSKPAATITSSNIIPSAGAAPLFNGVGDILPTGACDSFIKSYCKDITAGDGRLATCISKRQQEEKQGNVVGRKLSPKCVEEATNYSLDKVTNINKDVSLARACKDDVPKLCKGISDAKSSGSVISCLKDKSAELSAPCKAQVFRTQQEAVNDIRLDVQLYAACKSDLAKTCSSVEAGEGREATCLADNQMQISWDCKAQLLRHEQETQDDIRLSVKLFQKCLRDYKKFCKDVEPGHMRVQQCLEDKLDDPELSSGCKEELDGVLAKQVSNFRLNTRLRTHCQEDLQQTCGVALEDLDKDPKAKATGLKCLQHYKEELKNEKCKKAVHRMMSRAGRDIRFDEALANACTDDRKKFCVDVQPGSARVIRCLEDNRSGLDQKCAAALFDHETRMAEDIDFKYPMKRACVFEIRIFCKNTAHGHARVIRCLQAHLEDDDMGAECKTEVVADMHRMATDYRLNWRLNHACEADIGKLCPKMCSPGRPCGGLVLQCLQEKQDNITSSDCQEEVFYYQLMEVSDFRNDVILAEACRTDVESYCRETEPGEGRVHQCLRFNRERISDRCRKEETKLAALEYRDIRLRPKLNKLCSEEKAVFCKDTKPGRARVIKCLMESMAKPNFGQECKVELESREEMMKSDYRYDVGVATGCKADIDTLCAAQASQLRGNATVLKCLVEHFKATGEVCQTELSRAVRLALWSFKPGAGLTEVCDRDVLMQCPKGAMLKSSAPLTIGMVGRCLSKLLVTGKKLEDKCRELVLVAAPKDNRAYYDFPDTTSGIVKRIAEMQKAAGLEAVLVDPYSRSGSTVTVTGWVALACMMSLVVVFFGSLIMLYRKYSGIDKPQTLHVKMGDA